jgi:AcrR family transcriptional regulator
VTGTNPRPTARPTGSQTGHPTGRPTGLAAGRTGQHTRERLLTATNELFRRRGYHGTSLKQVTAAAGAPTGSLYHFFPGGKDELAAEVIAGSGAVYQELFEAIAGAAADAPSAVTDFFDGAATVLEETDFIDPCPIGTVAREIANTNEPLRRATADVFASWTGAVVAYLRAQGFEPDTCDDVATTLIGALEGAFVLARAQRDATPLRAAGRVMRALIESLPRASHARPRGYGASR